MPVIEFSNQHNVVFFPTYGHQNDGSARWNVHIHGWIYHSEVSSKLRAAVLNWLRKRTELKHTESVARILDKRLRAFLVRNEKGSELVVRLGEQLVKMPKSSKNGHFIHTIEFEPPHNPDPNSDHWMEFQLDIPEESERQFHGQFQLISAEGVSVISDIDDTLKITNVAKRRELLANTFMREFQPFDQLAEVYQFWERQGVRFHYVSASPWQLYLPLAEYLMVSGYPRGSMHLQEFRLKDKIGLRKFKAAGRAKLTAIKQILAAFPLRTFMLVGDSGERDPELYGELKRQYPQQIARIYIRNLGGENDTEDRWEHAFDGINPDDWQLFTDAKDLLDKPVVV